jgi:hypothetical protein
MACTTRTTAYGYSIYELIACGTAASATAPGPLPITLLDFTARPQTAAVGLAWHTASEVNSTRFEVQRSLNGNAFTTLGSMVAPGTSTTTTAYTYRDAAVPTGANQLYYRLRQLDQNGTSSYSPARTVSLTVAGRLALYPNPAHSIVRLAGAATTSAVHLFDALGRTLASATTDETSKATLSLPVS